MARPRSFQRLRDLPVVGRAMDWGMGPIAVSGKTREAGARISGLKATEGVALVTLAGPHLAGFSKARSSAHP